MAVAVAGDVVEAVAAMLILLPLRLSLAGGGAGPTS